MDNPVITTEPANPAYSLANAKTQMRVSHTDDDALITRYLNVAEKYIEEYLSRSLVSTGWTWYLDRFTNGNRDETADFWFSRIPYGQRSPGVIYFPIKPVTAITSFTYTDPAGNSQSLTSGDYELDLINGRLMPSASLGVWPQVSTDVFNPITLVFTAGYGADDSDVPEKIKQALYMLAAFWYENRETEISSPFFFQAVPNGFDELLNEYRKGAF